MAHVPANTLILNFWTPKPWGNQFLLFFATQFVILGYGSLSKLIGTRPAARSSLRQSKTQFPPGSADKRIPEMPDWLSAASQISSSAAVLLFWPPTVKSLQPSDLSLTDQTAQSRKGDIWLEKQYKTWFSGHEFTPEPKKICMFW